MRSSWMMHGLLFACMLSFTRGMIAQDLQVLVLDALNGKPQASVKVEYFCTGRPRITQPNPAMTSPSRTITNSGGLALFANPCGREEEIEISVYPPDKKEQCGVGPVTLREIISVGFVSKPDADGGIWCPTKVSKTLKPVPGQVIMFVKKPTWWQSHVAG